MHLDCTPPPDVEETDEDDDEPTALAARVARLTGWRLAIWCNPWMSEQQRRGVLGI